MVYGKILIILTCLYFTASCSKQYEVNVKEQKDSWEQQFVASSMPYSGSSLKVDVIGNVNGVALISAYPSSQHVESIKSTTVGPGKFVFSLEELEYWNKSVLLKYEPEANVVGSFSIKVKFDGK
ncbi:MAG: hypothetical protein OEY52_02410 [Gammaproteobacteria bacterium]|nr:hypothetical protein [Gammaproteobacteria bacterium]